MMVVVLGEAVAALIVMASDTTTNMSYTMKKTIMTTALIAGLIGAAGTASAATNSRPASCPPPGVAAGPAAAQGAGIGPGSRAVMGPGVGMRPGARQARPSMRQALGLSDRQEIKMIELRQQFFNHSRPVMMNLRSMGRDLALESVKKHPDNRKIDKLARKIGQAHIRLAELESRNLHDVASVLNDRQLDMFIHMKNNHHGMHWKKG